ncbi:hypothetical protein [Nostoc sp.]
MLDCYIAIAFWVNWKFYFLVAAFQHGNHYFRLVAECIPNLVSKILRDAGMYGSSVNSFLLFQDINSLVLATFAITVYGRGNF